MDGAQAGGPAGQPMGRRGREGGREGRAFPKGRQVDPAALALVREVLGDRPRDRDLLIEHLHLLQDGQGALFPAHLAALAHEMRLAFAEVYEVATFYAHFDVLADGEAAPPPLTVRVCYSIACVLRGADDLVRQAQEMLGDGVRVVRAPCMGRCDLAPTAELGHRHIDGADAAKLAAAVAAGDTHPAIPAYQDLAAYRAEGGYRILSECLSGIRSREDIQGLLEHSGLRGLGGAGFVAGTKSRLVAQQPAPRLMAVNGDEGEPGTFKDRFYLERRPHQVLEGMLIGAWLVEADAIYLYLRDEYPAAREILLREIAALSEAGLGAGMPIHLRRGAGAYICGEESAMIESIEGKRGLPRHKPPYPSQVGLFGRPTLTHNIETVYWFPEIIAKGPDWWASHGRNGRKGLRSYSVSGRVKEPGVKLAPAGISLRELVTEYCGGMAEGHRLKGYLPGGASGGILPAHLDRVPLDFGTLEQYGCFIGSAAVVVLSDQDNMREVARNLMAFFADESCGQCTPCRVGTEKALALMGAEVWDEVLLTELSQAMRDASICGLGQAAPNPLVCAMQYFPEDF